MNSEKVKKIIAECTFSGDELPDDELSLVYDLHMDSVIFTEMVCLLEEGFGITINESDVSEVYLVKDVSCLVNEKVKQKAPQLQR